MATRAKFIQSKCLWHVNFINLCHLVIKQLICVFLCKRVIADMAHALSRVISCNNCKYLFLVGNLKNKPIVITALMYWSNWSFNIPPLGIPWAFHTFAVPGRREFDYQSLPGGGEFDPHALGVGNLNCTLWCGELSWGTRCWRIFVEEIVPLWPIGYKERTWTSSVPYLKVFKF